jgi:hypothetical protein
MMSERHQHQWHLGARIEHTPKIGILLRPAFDAIDEPCNLLLDENRFGTVIQMASPGSSLTSFPAPSCAAGTI